jgi:hypothetical protein
MTRGDTICRGLGAAPLVFASVRLVRSYYSKTAAASAFVLQPPSPDHRPPAPHHTHHSAHHKLCLSKALIDTSQLTTTTSGTLFADVGIATFRRRPQVSCAILLQSRAAAIIFGVEEEGHTEQRRDTLAGGEQVCYCPSCTGAAFTLRYLAQP